MTLEQIRTNHMNPITRTTFDRFVFWLFLIPGTCLCLVDCVESIAAMIGHNTLWHRDPGFVLRSMICSAALSIIGIVSIINYLRKKEWRILTIIAAISGALIFGFMSIRTQLRSGPSLYPIDIALIIATLWCIVVIYRLSYEIKHNG